MKYFIKPFLLIFKFNGRSDIKEFWYFFAINFAISITLTLTKKIHGIDEMGNYYRYFYIIPLISLGFRRIQDTGKSGWLFLIPVVNLILAAFPGENNANKYGEPVTD